MARYRRRSYKSWRSRGYGSGSSPTKYSVLNRLLGQAVGKIRSAFLDLDEDALESLLIDYGAIHGKAAENYAKKAYPKWRSGATKLSGQTMERLVELVPPYLDPEQRFEILKDVLTHHKQRVVIRTIRVNVKDMTPGFNEIDEALSALTVTDQLAHLPEHVMEAAKWLYEDDITVARAMLAEASRNENELIRATAVRELTILKRTIQSGQVSAASYSVNMPSGGLSIVAYTPSKCFVATVCFGQDAVETRSLRLWRDAYLAERAWGRKFIVWYYTNGERWSLVVNKYKVLKIISRGCIGAVAYFMVRKYGVK